MRCRASICPFEVKAFQFAMNWLSGYSNDRLKECRLATRPSILTRRRILKAATRSFAEHGYEAASIRDIVTKADVNQAAINYHFRDKAGKPF